jgi:hypothetical protein
MPPLYHNFCRQFPTKAVKKIPNAVIEMQKSKAWLSASILAPMFGWMRDEGEDTRSSELLDFQLLAHLVFLLEHAESHFFFLAAALS